MGRAWGRARVLISVAVASLREKPVVGGSGVLLPAGPAFTVIDAVAVMEPVEAEVSVTVQMVAVVVQVDEPSVPVPVLEKLIVVPLGTLTRPCPSPLSTFAVTVKVCGRLTSLVGVS